MATPHTQISREASSAAHAAVIGNEALKGKLLGSGPILKKIDQLAAEVCWYVARKNVVTVAFDTFQLIRPIFHGDFVRLEGRVLSVSNSSISCQTSVYRQEPTTGEFELTHNCVATFVAIDENGKAAGGLPQLFDPAQPEECQRLAELVKQRKQLSARWRHSQNEVGTMRHITHAMIPRSPPTSPSMQLVNIRDTVIETRHPFLVKHANNHYNVFGGVILDWMDRAALHCARTFTKNEYMVTIAMNRVHFKLPIRLSDIISIRARICRVKKHSLEVEIAVYRIENRVEQVSHAGYFEVLNLKALEAPTRRKEILVQVTADESDQDGMQALLKAHRRQLFEKDDAELLKMPPIPLTISKKFSLPAKL